MHCSTLSDHVRYHFVDIVMNCRAMGVDASQAHLARIQGSHLVESKQPLYSCSFCILQRPSWTLDCKHMLCRRCINAHATSGQSYHPQVKSCPLCQSPNSSPFFIKPPTASAIALNLRGTNPVKIIQFLKDLRRSVGFPLQDCFDIVIGSEAGKSTFGFSNMRANVS